MSVNLNKHYVEAVITDVKLNQQKIKLPLSRQSLNKALIEFNVVDIDNLNIDFFDKEMNRVRRIEKLDDFKVESPTNIYYLNEYLSILKEKKIPLKATMTIDTAILKKEIANLLDIENEDITIREIDEIRKSKTSSSNKNSNEKPNEKKEMKEKPMFRIADILKKQRERKLKK